MTRRMSMPIIAVFSLCCFAILATLTPLLIVFRWFGMVPSNIVPDVMIGALVFVTILAGFILSRKNMLKP